MEANNQALTSSNSEPTLIISDIQELLQLEILSQPLKVQELQFLPKQALHLNGNKIYLRN